MKKVEIFNTCIDSISTKELIKELDAKGGVVFTPNVDHVMKLQKDAEFYEVYQQADYRVCDGQILYWSLNFLNKPIKEKISGSRFFPAFYSSQKNNKNTKIFLLGAAAGVAKRAQIAINKKVGREIVIDSYSPSYGFENNSEECSYIVERINQSQANVLVVGLGCPKQEKWIVKYKSKLPNVRIFLAVGASIDFEAGNKNLAPKWIGDCGLETPYRLMCEPRRLWRRYLIEHPPFFWLLLLEKLKIYKNPFTFQRHIVSRDF